MAGHSKWNNIRRKKEKTDAQKAKIFMKISKEISVAVKEYGTDFNINSKLKELILKAKMNNLPNDNIERIIKKASGNNDKNNYERIIYEGYGPNGVAIIIEALTDNRNRTAGDLRHYFDKFGGNLGQTGCVSFLFLAKGIISFLFNNIENYDKFLDDCLNIDGIEDIKNDDEYIEIYTISDKMIEIKDKLESLGYKSLESSINKIPATYIEISDEEVKLKLNKLLDLLEDNDDVNNVWHNCNM